MIGGGLRQMLDYSTIVLSIVGAGGGGAAIAYAVFKTLGAKWLDNHFAGRLQALKHSHDQEMAHLKLRIDGQLDRAVKLNQREFEIIPTIWGAMSDAHYAMMRMMSMWQESPDMSHWTEPQFEAFLADSWLDDWQKDEMRAKSGYERTSYYSDKSRWFRLREAHKDLIKFNQAQIANSVFLHPDTAAKIEEFADMMRKAFSRWRMNMTMGDEFKDDYSDKDSPISVYREKGDTAYEELATYLRQRFWTE